MSSLVRSTVSMICHLLLLRICADAFTQPRLPARRLCRSPAAPRPPDEPQSWAAKNPEALAFVCGGLFGLVPSAPVLTAASADELAQALAAAAATPIYTNGRWPFLGFAPVLGLAASGALADFKTLRVRAASLVSFGLVSQAAGRVAVELTRFDFGGS